MRKAVLENEPEAIVHEATALANVKFGRNFDKVIAKTNELRTKGTDALLAAAREAGVRRFVAQSFASYRYAREGGPIKTEDDPLDPTHRRRTRSRAAAAMTYLEQAVTDFGGIALRYGVFYGAANDGSIEPVRKRQFPIVGDGGGISPGSTSTTPLRQPFSRSNTTARRSTTSSTTILRRCANGCPCSPRPSARSHPGAPTWLARLLAGEAVVVMATEARGASNAKAKRELGWTLRYPSWRQGFPAVYSGSTASAAPRIGEPART